jgi:cytochrome o ubiquinol oxidase subunit II
MKEKINLHRVRWPIFGLALFLGGCNAVLMNPKGQVGLEQKHLIFTAIGLMLIVVLPVIFMALFFAWKYRASNTKAKYTPEWSHSSAIEFVVWLIPCIIIAILGTITWKTTHSLDPHQPIVSKQKPILIEVMALDWKWLFIYPEQGIATINKIEFPVNTPVVFKITSESVMNSFFIPQLGSQIYAMPGMVTTLHLIANEVGTYQGLSANYSGGGFSGMKFEAVATKTPEEFAQWIDQAKLSSNKLTIASFNELAKPSENSPVTYYSSFDPSLYTTILNKYMGWDMTLTCGPRTVFTPANIIGAAK